MSSNKKSLFTEAELAEMEAYDRLCELEPLTKEEIEASEKRDFFAYVDSLDHETAEIVKRKKNHYQKTVANGCTKTKTPEQVARCREQNDVWRKKNRERVNELENRRFHAKMERRRQEEIKILLERSLTERNATLTLYRIELRMTKRDVAKFLGKSEQTISSWEKGLTKVPDWALDALLNEKRRGQLCIS